MGWPTQRLVVAVCAGIAAAAALLGPWWDLGFEDAGVLLCADHLSEVTPFSEVSRLVPPRLGCEVGGRVVASAGGLGDQVGLLVVGLALAGAAALRLRVAAAAFVLVLVALCGLGADVQAELIAPVMLAYLGTPVIAAAIVFHREPAGVALRRWIVLTCAVWTGFFAVLLPYLLGLTIWAAAAIGMVVGTAMDRLVRVGTDELSASSPSHAP